MTRLKGRRPLPPLPLLVTLLVLAIVLVVVVVRQVGRNATRSTQTVQPTLAPLTRGAPQSATLMGKVKTAANFRTGPSVQASIIRLLNPGTDARLIARQQGAGGGWYVVQVAGQEGWLSDQVLDIDPAVAAFVPVRTATVPGP